MNEVCRALPQEWASLVPALEYLCDIAPRGSRGLSAVDLTQGFALATDVDRQTVPFSIVLGQAETDAAKKFFDNFRELYGVFTRATALEAQQEQDGLNRKRNYRIFGEGEQVFRRLPKCARSPKHLFGESATGPYVVVDQRSLSSVVLRDLQTNELVDNGANIPLEQILARPRRSKLLFEPDDPSEVCGVGQMTHRGGADPRAGRLRGTGRRKGWAGLSGGAFDAYQTVAHGPTEKELAVSKVIKNLPADERGLVQPYRGVWRQVRVCKIPLYFAEQRGHVTTELSTRRLEDSVRHAALVLQVELLTGGELTCGSARMLSNSGWGLLVEDAEQVVHIRLAVDEAPDLGVQRSPIRLKGKCCLVAHATPHVCCTVGLHPRLAAFRPSLFHVLPWQVSG